MTSAARRSRTTWAIPALFVALVVAIALWNSRPYEGTAPAGVSFSLIDGRQLALDALRGRPVLVSFWASSCPACLREIPHLKALYRDGGPLGLTMIAVAMPYDPPNEVLELAAERELPYPVAIDVQGRVLAAFAKVPGTPTHFLIDPAGRVVLHEVGTLDTGRVLSLVREMSAGSRDA